MPEGHERGHNGFSSEILAQFGVTIVVCGGVFYLRLDFPYLDPINNATYTISPEKMRKKSHTTTQKMFPKRKNDPM